MSNSIDIKHVTLRYKAADFNAVENVSLTLKKGEILGLIGPNGAGKTTLISILTGLRNPDHGTVFIEGLDLSKEAYKIRELIGVVPQEYAVYPKLTAYENLQFFGSMYGVPKKELAKRITIGIEEMGLTKFANKRLETFSGGMKRRINLLAGILHRPQLIFLDEPTVGVDVQSKRVIISYLNQLNQQGATIVHCSHLLHEAQTFCSQVAIIDQGKIKVSGPTQEVLIKDGKIMTLEELFLETTGNHELNNE